jgi:hypothetical protein
MDSIMTTGAIVIYSFMLSLIIVMLGEQAILFHRRGMARVRAFDRREAGKEYI